MLKNRNSLRRIVKFFDISLLLIFALGIFLFPNTAFLKTINQNNILELVNQERIKAGLLVLIPNQQLNDAAEKKAESIFAQQIFAHDIDEKKFSGWIKESGYKYSYIGENLAIDFISAEGALQAWLESTTHKQNILNPRFSETGIAIKEGSFNNVNTILVVQVFGTPLYSLPASVKPTSLNERYINFNSLGETLNKSTINNQNVYYFDSNYLNGSLAPGLITDNLPGKRISREIKINNWDGNQVLAGSDFYDKSDSIFLLTTILSLSMTLIYLFSNYLLRQNPVKQDR